MCVVSNVMTTKMVNLTARAFSLKDFAFVAFLLTMSCHNVTFHCATSGTYAVTSLLIAAIIVPCCLIPLHFVLSCDHSLNDVLHMPPSAAQMAA